MEPISNLSQTDFFTLIGILIFLIVVGLILPFFFVDGRKRKMQEGKNCLSEVLTEQDSVNSSEKE